MGVVTVVILTVILYLYNIFRIKYLFKYYNIIDFFLSILDNKMFFTLILYLYNIFRIKNHQYIYNIKILK